MFSSWKCLLSLLDVQVNSFASWKQEAGTHKKLKQKNYPSMKFPSSIFPILLPLPRSPLSAQDIWCLGRASISVVTPHLLSFIADNRWWKLISLFPCPTQETLIHFLLHGGNTKVESYYSGWIPPKSPPCSTSVRISPSIRPQTTAKSRHSSDHHKPELLAQAGQCFGADEHFFLLYTHLLYFF